MKLASNHKQIVESYGQTSFLEKKHDFSHLKSKNITEFQNFQLLKYRLGMSIEGTSRNYSNDFFSEVIKLKHSKQGRDILSYSIK